MDINRTFFKYFVYYPVVFVRKQNIPLYLKELLKTQFYPPERLQQIQLAKLRKMIRYAKQFVPYHSKALNKISPSKLCEIGDMARLPFTSKTSIKAHPEKFLSGEQFRLLTKKTTGGSTGEPVTIWKTSEAMARELASTWRGYLWAGIDIGDRQGRFWGVPFGTADRYRAKLTDFVTNRRRCSAFSFDEESLSRYTKMLSAFKPTYFYGYVSMITEYAEYFKKNAISPPFNLKCIIATSEVLTASHRNLLEYIFSTRVFNEYGCGELGSVAHECEMGSMHIMAENMIVEVMHGDRVCQPGEIGELVITELNNRAMPLIRYRTGDFGSLSTKQCACGRTLPIIEHIAGRAYDIIENKNGRMFHGEFFMYIFEEAKRNNLGVGAFQVIQIDYDRLKIKIKPEPGYSEKTERLIRNRIANGFGGDVKIVFEKVNRIAREPSGKMRLIVGMRHSNKG